MEQGQKRKADENSSRTNEKRQKTKKQWRVPRQNESNWNERKTIQPGDSGIWATCNKGRERQCVGELRDLFNEYAGLLYGDALPETALDQRPANTQGPSTNGIESEIQDEVAEMNHPTSAQLFTPIRLDVQCVVFFKTVAPVEPVAFVKKICEDASQNRERKRTRFVKRLSPMTLMGRASEEGLEKVAKEVLLPYFHQVPFHGRKFAIRPTLRNHNLLSRDNIINQVASIVGPGHEVNLKDYDLLIVVEVYQNICGMSVFDNSFERLRRYNLAEIFEPTPIGNGTTEEERANETLTSG